VSGLCCGGCEGRLDLGEDSLWGVVPARERVVVDEPRQRIQGKGELG
jgi:hypothetical protein